jgi:tetratricopeptide (TPR) repeat protein
MKKLAAALLFAAVVAVGLQAQYDSVNPIRVEVRNQFFTVISDGGSYDAEVLCQEMGLRFDVYNRLFRFNPVNLPGSLRVVAFTDKQAYDKYVTSKLGSTRDGAVYLHYSQPERRELVINRGSPDEERMLPHQAFIQFFRAFVPYPPTWMREGFAIYFNTLKFDKELRELQYEENLAWLETVKTLGMRQPSMESVFLADVNGMPEYMQPVSWAIVSFFLTSGGNGDYFRAITETFMLLSPAKSAAENSRTVLERLISWNSPDAMRVDYANYIASRQTFAELVDAGQQAYLERDFETAESFFLAAMYQKPTHYAPYYYMGLLAYDENNFDVAESYYLTSLQYGADSALVKYALGVNAATAGKNSEALLYLQEAANESPERYKDRAESIMSRLGN